MTKANFVTFDVSGIEPEHDAPAADRLISGNPKFRSWNLEDRDGNLFAGIWEATPGKWRIVYDEWEFCHILAGTLGHHRGRRRRPHCEGGRQLRHPPGLQGHLGGDRDHAQGIRDQA